MKFPDDKQNVYTATGIILGGVAAFCGLVFLQGIITAYVFSTLWGWYMVPFFGLKELPLVYAFGISLIINYFTPIYRGEDKRSLSEKIAGIFAHPIAALAIGWIGTAFI